MESEIYTWHGLYGLGQIMIYRLYPFHFFGCRWRYLGFICDLLKIRLSESSIFLLKNFSGEFLYDFKFSNHSKILLIFRGSCSDLINSRLSMVHVTCKSHFPYVNSCESIVINWWRGQCPRNYSLVINKIYISSRRLTLLLFPSI